MGEVIGTDSLSHHKWGWHGLAEDSKLSAAREATRGFILILLFLSFYVSGPWRHSSVGKMYGYLCEGGDRKSDYLQHRLWKTSPGQCTLSLVLLCSLALKYW